jgi:ABC-type antimicrobial peptide transport system permease subunit
MRTTASPSALAPLMRGVIASEDDRLSIARLDLGPDLVGRTLVQERMVAILLVAFGVLALGLACLGLYGLIAYDVTQRTSELGIRMALGAQRSDVLRIVMRRAIVWIAAGVALGVPLVFTSAGIARSLLFGLTPTDPMTLAGAVLVIAAMGILAAYIPARRATRVDPLVALRAE